MENNGLSLADIASVTKDHDGAFGSDGLWIFALLILLFGGNGGFGFGNNNGLAQTDLNLLNAIQNGQREVSSDVQRTAYENMATTKDASHLEFGDKVEVVGRIQSRTYVKDKALHITYEVSTERIISI